MKRTAKKRYDEPVDDSTEAGVEAEFRYTPARFKRVPRETLPLATPEDLRPRNTKVRINIHLDLDVLNYFKKRAAQLNAAPYQTQINSELRAIMESDQGNPYAALVNDDRFIAAVAARVQEEKQ